MDSLLADERFCVEEAMGYYRGIADYLSQGIPAISTVFLSDTTVLRPEVVAVMVCDSLSGSIDPGSIEMLVDDRPVKARYYADRQEARWPADTDWANGRHTVAVAVRNIHGNSSRQCNALVQVNRPAATLTLSARPLHAACDSTGVVMLEAAVLDTYGLPIADGQPVRFGSPDLPLRYETGLTRQGRARTYFNNPPACTARVAVVCGAQTALLFLPPCPVPGPLVNGFVSAADDSTLWLDSVTVLLRDSVVTMTNREGFYAFTPAKNADTLLWFRKNGRLPLARGIGRADKKMRRLDANLAPAFNGVLRDKIVLIDPEPPVDSAAGTADVNLQTAQFLRDYLTLAGAQVRLTRASGPALSPYAKVKLANQIKAQFFITLRHAAGYDTTNNGPSIGRYYLSGEGARLAGLAGEELKRQLALPAVQSVPDFGYVVMQTGCPAIVVNTPRLPLPVASATAIAPARCRKEAYAVFTALVRLCAGADTLFTREHKGVALDQRNGRPAVDALVTLDNFITLSTEHDGKYLFRCLSAGEHTVRVQAGKTFLKEEKFVVP
jgi:N-acetylmuramoyl-L-alanine amidase